MGSVHSSAAATDVSYGNIELATLTEQFVAIDARFCHDAPLRLKLKKMFSPNKIAFKDLETKHVVFRSGLDRAAFTELLDAEKRSIAHLKPTRQRGVRTLFVNGTNAATEPLGDVHVKLGESNSLWFEDSMLRIDFRDALSGQLCSITFDGDWRKHSGIFWLERGGAPKVAVARVAVLPKVLKHSYVLEVAAHADAALLLLLAVVLEDVLRIDRLEYNQRLLDPRDPSEWNRHPGR